MDLTGAQQHRDVRMPQRPQTVAGLTHQQIGEPRRDADAQDRAGALKFTCRPSGPHCVQHRGRGRNVDVVNACGPALRGDPQARFLDAVDHHCDPVWQHLDRREIPVTQSHRRRPRAMGLAKRTCPLQAAPGDQHKTGTVAQQGADDAAPTAP